MTTQIIQAFAKAGVKMTKAERIWRYLKDRPGLTEKQIEAGLHMTYISSPMHYMKSAGLIEARKSYHNNRQVNFHYAKGAEFCSDGLYCGAAKKKKDVALPQPAPQPAPQAGFQPASQPVFQPTPQRPAAVAGIDLDSLTIGEARSLYNQLKKMFGAQP